MNTDYKDNEFSEESFKIGPPTNVRRASASSPKTEIQPPQEAKADETAKGALATFSEALTSVTNFFSKQPRFISSIKEHLDDAGITLSQKVRHMTYYLQGTEVNKKLNSAIYHLKVVTDSSKTLADAKQELILAKLAANKKLIELQGKITELKGQYKNAKEEIKGQFAELTMEARKEWKEHKSALITAMEPQLNEIQTEIQALREKVFKLEDKIEQLVTKKFREMDPFNFKHEINTSPQKEDEEKIKRFTGEYETIGQFGSTEGIELQPELHQLIKDKMTTLKETTDKLARKDFAKFVDNQEAEKSISKLAEIKNLIVEREESLADIESKTALTQIGGEKFHQELGVIEEMILSQEKSLIKLEEKEAPRTELIKLQNLLKEAIEADEKLVLKEDEIKIKDRKFGLDSQSGASGKAAATVDHILKQIGIALDADTDHDPELMNTATNMIKELNQNPWIQNVFEHNPEKENLKTELQSIQNKIRKKETSVAERNNSNSPPPPDATLWKRLTNPPANDQFQTRFLYSYPTLVENAEGLLKMLSDNFDKATLYQQHQALLIAASWLNDDGINNREFTNPKVENWLHSLTSKAINSGSPMLKSQAEKMETQLKEKIEATDIAKTSISNGGNDFTTQLESIAKGELPKTEYKAAVKQFASDLSTITAHDFSRLSPSVLMKQLYSDPNKVETQPTEIKELATHFDQISNFIVNAILKRNDSKERDRLVHFFLAVQKKLAKEGQKDGIMDLSSSGAITAALNKTAIGRLNCTKKQSVQVELYTTYINNVSNYAAAKAVIREARVPVIPYLGQFLGELVFGKDGNPSTVNDQINTARAEMLGDIVQRLMDSQKKIHRESNQLHFNLAPIFQPSIEDTIYNNDREASARSLALEPRIERQPK